MSTVAEPLAKSGETWNFRVAQELMQLADEAQGRIRCGIVHADGSQLNLVGIIGGVDGCLLSETMTSSSFMSIGCHWKRVFPVLCLKEENSSSSFQSEFGQISFGTLSRKSSWSGNTSMLRKDVGSIRVARARSRLQLVEAALASGIESSGDASTSSRDHELLQVNLQVPKRELKSEILSYDVFLWSEVFERQPSAKKILCN